MKIIINKNGEFIEVEAAELADSVSNYEESEIKDGLTSLAEGLSTVTSLAQIRETAKAVLSNEGVVENE